MKWSGVKWLIKKHVEEQSKYIGQKICDVQISIRNKIFMIEMKWL